MNKLHLFSTVLALTLFSCTLNAQNWEIGVGLNAMNYQGDVVQPSLFTLKETQPNLSLFARRNFADDKFALRLGVNFGKLSGDDTNFTDPSWRQTRKFNFTTSLTELAAILEWTPLSTEKADGSQRKVLPYLFGGLALALTNPTVSFNENSPSNAALKTRIAADKANVKTSALAIPIGAGFKFPLAKGTLGVEMGFRPTTSDYIDGISQSANPNKKDWYVIGGVNYAFRFGGGNKTSKRATKNQDSDGDGVADNLDKCPDLVGPVSNNGCPLLSPLDAQVIQEAVANINFETASANLTSESTSILDNIADVLTRNPYYNVSVDGHTDSQGKEASNLILSKARAAACLKHLLGKGIDPNRMSSNGFGSSKPVAENTTEAGRRKNRRVEFNLSVK